jgi:hypothetical protein
MIDRGQQLRQKAVEIALKEQGEKPIAKPLTGPIEKYLATVGLADGTFYNYCGAFINWFSPQAREQPDYRCLPLGDRHEARRVK